MDCSHVVDHHSTSAFTERRCTSTTPVRSIATWPHQFCTPNVTLVPCLSSDPVQDRVPNVHSTHQPVSRVGYINDVVAHAIIRRQQLYDLPPDSTPSLHVPRQNLVVEPSLQLDLKCGSHPQSVRAAKTVCQFGQESCAIAKMTAQCALYMGAMKNFGTPWLRPRLLFPNFSWAFVRIDPMNVPTKFEVRSFTRSWDN